VQKPTLPKGTRDFGPRETAKRQYIIEKIESNFQKYGFSKIETPTMENLSVLTGKYGDEGEQLLFKVLNNGDFSKDVTTEDLEAGSNGLLPKMSKKGLRYDLTVPFARFVVMNRNELAFPFKRYQIQPVWRGDRPQKGRYQEFYQCDVDIIGTKSIWNEVELTLLIDDVFADLGLEAYELKINHREILFGLAEWSGAKGKEVAFCAIVDKLDKIGPNKVIEELGALGCDSARLDDLMRYMVTEGDNESKVRLIKEILPGNNAIEVIEDYLRLLGDARETPSRLQLDWSLARGLSYYTGMIYEVKPTRVTMGSILGGGRYDDLTGIFGMPDVSGIGISFGLDRIYDVMEEMQLFPAHTLEHLKALVTHFDDASFRYGAKLVTELREAGVRSDIYPEVSKIKKQVTYANKIGVPYVITIGSQEMEEGVFSLKNMQSGDQKKLSWQSIVTELR